jgi:archaeosine synthase alpha-subunit
VRTVERFEGLALQGAGSVGPLRFPLPGVLNAVGPGEEAAPPFVSWAPSPSGTRRVVLGDGTGRLELSLPVPVPEIVPVGSGVVTLEGGIVLLHAPFDRSALERLRSGPRELLVLGNARALWRDGEPFVEALGAIRAAVGSEPLLWAPRVGLPHRLPLLAYLGVDLVDTTEGELRAAEGEFLDPTLGPRPLSDDRERGCDCAACGSQPPGSLVAHARSLYRRAALETSSALARGALRELVEARLASEPAMAEMLRRADRELASMLESRAPVTGSSLRSYVFAEAHRRPEMRRFRERILDRYRPPPSKSVLLLVPCSRTKPYRLSPSHRRFATSWDGRRGAERVHVVSVSSPIGLVPRELEDLPPARNYDIPVTGDWSAEERDVVLAGLRHLLSEGAYRTVIVHLPPEEAEFVREAVPSDRRSSETVVDGRPTSPASLAALRNAVGLALDGAGGTSPGPLGVRREELRELASVQFGRLAASRLFAAPLRLAGRPWFQRLTDGSKDLASVREERGLFHLTVGGALRMGDAVARIDVEAGVSLEGDVFAPGVVRADPSIRAGDAVALFRDGSLAAVGEAALPGPLLGDLRRGLAVRVRHRRHEPADTSKTVEPPSSVGPVVEG